MTTKPSGASARVSPATRAAASDGFEEDMLPRTICGNCLGDNQVSFDARSGRRLCVDCEPHPDHSEGDC